MPVRSATAAVSGSTRRSSFSAHRREQPPDTKQPAPRLVARAPKAPTRLPKLINLPDVRQGTSYTCGTASLMSLMAYWGWRGNDPNEKDLAKELGTSWKNGTEPGEIVRMGRKLGLRVSKEAHLTLDDLAREVKAGHPVMVAYQAYADEAGPFPHKKPWRDDWNDGHWSLVIGIDEHNVYLEDPSMLGKRGFIPRAEFLERWHDTDRGNRPVYHQLGLVFACDTPRKNLNEVIVKRFEYVP